MTVGGHNRGDVKEEARPVGSLGGASYHRLGRLNEMTKNIKRDQRGLGLRRLLSMILHATTNQK